MWVIMTRGHILGGGFLGNDTGLQTPSFASRQS